jgi:RNA polymerase sigma factor (sigma-70 family)
MTGSGSMSQASVTEISMDRNAVARNEFVTRLVRTHYERMRVTAIGCLHRYRLQHDAEADDLVNSVVEVVLRVSQRLDEMPPQQMSIYLDQAVRRKAIDLYRAKHRQMRDVRKQASTSVEMLDVCRDSSIEAPDIQMEELLGTMYDTLSADERAIAMLRRSGHEWRDIAERLGRTEGAVRMQFQREIARLKTRLAQGNQKD